MPMELKLAKPQRANVAIAKVRGSSVAFMGPSCPNATNSLITMRVPRRLPILPASCQGTPISQATGAKIHPKIVCKFSGGFLRQLPGRSEEHTSELQSRSDIVCRLLLEKQK